MSPRRSITWKLLASYGLVLLVAMATHLLVAYPLAAGQVTEYAHQTAMGSALSGHLLGSLLRSLLWAGLAAVVVAAGLALLLARGITRPIQRMVEATRRVAAGDYRERVPVASRDELGQLAAALNEMAAGLERVEGLRRELVANVAHELGTPLAGLEGYLEGLADGVFAPTPETLARMRAETARLRRLVDDLTELSQLESGRWRLERRPVQVAHVAAAVEDALRLQFERKGVGLDVTVAEGLPPVPADTGRLGQVLTNLLANSLRSTPPGGRVTVEAWVERDSVRLAVSDTGGGIAPEDLPHVFERFYRADRARAQATGGSGIGLAIVKHIVESHGGTVTAESVPTRGSRFEVPPAPRRACGVGGTSSLGQSRLAGGWATRRRRRDAVRPVPGRVTAEGPAVTAQDPASACDLTRAGSRVHAAWRAPVCRGTMRCPWKASPRSVPSVMSSTPASPVVPTRCSSWLMPCWRRPRSLRRRT